MKVEKSDLQLETIVSRIKAGELDLQPDFQRGEIWDTKRRQRLVDTILRGWYVPAVHIVVTDDGNEVVLDGQQRLAAIRDFFEDELRIDGTMEPIDDEISSLHGLRYSKLPSHVKRAVNRFILSTVRLVDYVPQEPNELFFRLNQAYTLTPPEKRNALHGRARDQVKALVAELTEDGLLDRQTVGFANSRLAYDDIIARTCVAVEIGDLRQHINNNVVEEFYRAREFTRSTLEGVREAGALLGSLIGSVAGGVRFNKGTLQTWLIYCYWAPLVTGSVPAALLARFEVERLRLRRGDTIGSDGDAHLRTEILRMYDDRASYRVTDVSSVLVRDLAVHLYSARCFGTPDVRESSGLAEHLLMEDGSTAATVGAYLSQSSWGVLPRSGAHA